MRPPLHDPVRGADESQADFRVRRSASAAASRTFERGPTQTPWRAANDGLDYVPVMGSFWLGQHTNPQANLRRKAKRDTSARQFLRHVRAARFYARTAP